MHLLNGMQTIMERREQGQILVMFALAFLVLAGGLGMGADMGLWLMEREHLQTATDSAAIAGARYFVVYTGAGASTQLTQARTAAQTYLTQYGYPTSNLDAGYPIITSPGTRMVQIQTRKTVPTLLLKFIGISSLQANANAVGNGEIKADIYAALDITGSMNATDITNTRAAVSSFISNLGLDPTDAQGPQLALGEFVGERCARINPTLTATSNRWDVTLRNADGTGGMDPEANTNWISRSNWQSTVGGYCDTAAPPILYSGGVFSLPALGTAPPNPGGIYAIPFYPGSATVQQLTKTASLVSAKVATVRNSPTFSSWTGTEPTPAAAPSLDPYWGADNISATSHTAGLVTAAVELNSVRARGSPYRKVLILQTDGIACTTEVPFTAAQSQTRATALATQLKNNPTPFTGIEIFTIMFTDFTDPTETCPNNRVNDNGGSLNPSACGPGNTALPAASARGPVDNYLISMSSSATGTCDHYVPASKAVGGSLANAYIEILKKLAVGKIVS